MGNCQKPTWSPKSLGGAVPAFPRLDSCIPKRIPWRGKDPGEPFPHIPGGIPSSRRFRVGQGEGERGGSPKDFPSSGRFGGDIPTFPRNSQLGKDPGGLGEEFWIPWGEARVDRGHGVPPLGFPWSEFEKIPVFQFQSQIFWHFQVLASSFFNI